MGALGVQDVQVFSEFQDMREPSVYMMGGWATEAGLGVWTCSGRVRASNLPGERQSSLETQASGYPAQTILQFLMPKYVLNLFIDSHNGTL